MGDNFVDKHRNCKQYPMLLIESESPRIEVRWTTTLLTNTEEQYWKALYKYYNDKKQYMAASQILESAATSGISIAKREFNLKFNTPSNAKYFMLVYKTTLKALYNHLQKHLSQHKHYGQVTAERNTLPKTDHMLEEMIPELNRILKLDPQTVSVDSTDLMKLQLASDFEQCLSMRSHIASKRNAWQLFKDYINNTDRNLKISPEQLNAVDSLFTTLNNELNKHLNMLNNTAEKVGMALCSPAQANELNQYVMLEKLEQLVSAYKENNIRP